MKNTTGNPVNIKTFATRESLISANSDLLETLHKRLAVVRFRPAEGDSIKLAYIRVYIQALQAQNAILKDSELDDLKLELDELKELVKSQSKP